jgi:cytochrome b pre-mRNA-processing protein 3
MILDGWRKRRANRGLIDQLHGAIVSAARSPALYLDYRVADTLDGRFEMVALHAGLTLRRLGALGPIGEEIAQELADAVFRHFDVAFREMGVGDVTVPKRMKKMAEAFYGRCKAYGEALDQGSQGSLAAALARNVYATRDQPAALQAVALSEYAFRCVEALDRIPLESFAAGHVAFPEPTPQTASA